MLDSDNTPCYTHTELEFDDHHARRANRNFCKHVNFVSEREIDPIDVRYQVERRLESQARFQLECERTYREEGNRIYVQDLLVE